MLLGKIKAFSGTVARKHGKHRLLQEKVFINTRQIIHVSRVILESNRLSDPHHVSAGRIAANDSSERMQAAEAFKDVSVKVRLQNAALATALTGFVAGVYLYSIQAVGGDIKNGDGEESGALQYLEVAAAEAKRMRDEKLRQERHLEGILSDDEESDEDDTSIEAETKDPSKVKRSRFFFWKGDK
jgi:hypothetical protein